MRGVTERRLQNIRAVSISTRTPHAGSDSSFPQLGPRFGTFQPALPMRGVTPSQVKATNTYIKFQPALPMRGVTFIASAPS